MNLNSIDHFKWENLLRDSIEKQGKKDKYIIIKDNHISLGERGQKLSIPQIIKISEATFKSLEEAYADGSITKRTFQKRVENISRYTDQLIDNRIAKRDHILKIAGRLFVSLIFPYIGPAIVWYKGNKFDLEISQFKNRLKVKQKLIAIALRLNLNGTENLTKIERLINQGIPDVFKEVSQLVKDENQEALINKRMKTDFPKEGQPVIQFQKDMRRGDSFLRIDAQNQIKDTVPQPPRLIGEPTAEAMDQRAMDAISLLKKFVDGDKDWEIALQLVANQTSIISLFDPCILVFNIKAAGAGWKNPKDGEDYAVKAGFRDKNPPIKLEIIRNERTGQIEKAHVEVEGYLNISTSKVSNRSQTKEDSSRVLVPNAIKGSLRYTVTLGEDRRPVISNLKSKLAVQNTFKV